jgi:hypothetical protein
MADANNDEHCRTVLMCTYVGTALLPKMLVISTLTICEIELLFLIRGMVERL